MHGNRRGASAGLSNASHASAKSNAESDRSATRKRRAVRLDLDFRIGRSDLVEIVEGGTDRQPASQKRARSRRQNSGPCGYPAQLRIIDASPPILRTRTVSWTSTSNRCGCPTVACCLCARRPGDLNRTDPPAMNPPSAPKIRSATSSSRTIPCYQIFRHGKTSCCVPAPSARAYPSRNHRAA